MAAVEISALRAHVGETVTLRGWVVTTRSSGKIAFLVLRDGTGTVQGVLSKKVSEQRSYFEERLSELSDYASEKASRVMNAMKGKKKGTRRKAVPYKS